jgi:anthranilate phosphoribosyltransferase
MVAERSTSKLSVNRSAAVNAASLDKHPQLEPRMRFRHYLGKIGSGEHTSTGLSREEAADAMELMLDGAASPAQIGAFLIAHRIRRPEPQELSGMLDVYRRRGPTLTSRTPAICFGMPFDGRSRTAPIYPLTALLLAAAGVPVVLQGGKRMPVKYGVTAAELFASLGLNLSGHPLSWVQASLDRWNLGLVHQPDHFQEADSLIEIRDQLGKRPPIASLELMWTAHQGEHCLVSGFVHPPTETRTWEALRLAGETNLVTVKGLEGGTDLPISRICVAGRCDASTDASTTERLRLNPRDHGLEGADPAWNNLEIWRDQALAALSGNGELANSLRWNCGTYLWLAKQCTNQETGLHRADTLLTSEAGLQLLEHMRQQPT